MLPPVTASLPKQDHYKQAAANYFIITNQQEDSFLLPLPSEAQPSCRQAGGWVGQSDSQQNVNTSIIPPNYAIKITITPAIVSPHPHSFPVSFLTLQHDDRPAVIGANVCCSVRLRQRGREKDEEGVGGRPTDTQRY